MYIVFEKTKEEEYYVYLSDKAVGVENSEQYGIANVHNTSYFFLPNLLKMEFCILAITNTFPSEPEKRIIHRELDIYLYHSYHNFSNGHVKISLSKDKQKLCDSKNYLIDLKVLEKKIISNRINKIQRTSYTEQ
jgi:hypothetical protein